MDVPKQEFSQPHNQTFELDDAQWDRQIASDLKVGKLDHLIANARIEMEAGLAVEI
jgi:hypothetical protein